MLRRKILSFLYDWKQAKDKKSLVICGPRQIGKTSIVKAFAKDYYEYTFRYYCKKNIMHVEIHMMLTDSIDESADYLKIVRQAYYNVKKDYPYFTLRIIGAGVKADNDRIETTRKC